MWHKIQAALIALAIGAVFVIAPQLLARAEDFTGRDSCTFLLGIFDDGNLSSAATDQCSGGSQRGSNDISWAGGYEGHITVDDGDVPASSPTDADSTYHDGTANSLAWVEADGAFASDDFSAGFWLKFEHGDWGMVLARWGASSSTAGEWGIRRQYNTNYRYKMSGTVQSASDFPTLPIDSWTWVAWSHDAGSGSGTLRSYTSESQVGNSVLDCTGGTQVCNTNATAMSSDVSIDYHFFANVVAGSNYEGNAYEMWYAEELYSEEEFCEICRCGYKDLAQGVGRVDECNRCVTRAYHRCRRHF